MIARRSFRRRGQTVSFRIRQPYYSSVHPFGNEGGFSVDATCRTPIVNTRRVAENGARWRDGCCPIRGDLLCAGCRLGPRRNRSLSISKSFCTESSLKVTARPAFGWFELSWVRSERPHRTSEVSARARKKNRDTATRRKRHPRGPPIVPEFYAAERSPGNKNAAGAYPCGVSFERGRRDSNPQPPDRQSSNDARK